MRNDGVSMSGLTLYTYFRSSAAYRVRITLNLKQLEYESAFIHLMKDGGQQRSEEYQHINPQMLIPSLKLETDDVLHQSLAIIEYLDETYPQAPLLPGNALQRAHIRAFALSICCDIHPLNNLRVLGYLRDALTISENQRTTWYQHWITQGFTALEKKLQRIPRNGPFCFGRTPTLADICLIPQVYNAIRFECDLNPYPLIQDINHHCLTLDAFKHAAPEMQADNE